MAYTDHFVKKQFKIPTLLSIPLILFITYFLGRVVLTPAQNAKASKNNVKTALVTNIFSNQAVVTWRADNKEQGWVVYGENKNSLNLIALDARDGGSKKEEYLNHYVPLKNLKEDTTYFFKIASKDGLASQKNNEPYSFKTIKKSANIGNLKPAYGKVVGKNGLPIENALIVLTVDNSLPLSTLSKATGEWLIPLNYIADSKTGSLKTLSDNEKVKLHLTSEQAESSEVEVVVSNLNPLPETIIIGKDYSLIEKKEVLSATAKEQTKNIKLDIVFPKANAIIPDNKPLIKGVFTPSSELQVSVTDGKNKTTKKITSDKDGLWKMNISTPLSAGKHTLEVKVGTGGTAQTQKREFTVAKSGETVLGEATAEPTLQPTRTPTPTKKLSITPTSSATASASPTVTPTPPVSGGNFFYLTVTSIALIAIGLSIFIYGLL